MVRGKKSYSSQHTDEEGFDAWGIGQRFVVVKFLNPLKEFNFAGKQARYGIIEGQSEYNYPQFEKQNRLSGLDRMYYIMITLSYDVYPFLKRTLRPLMLTLRNRIRTVKKLIGFVGKKNFDHVNHKETLFIDEEIFETCFDNLLDISTQMIELMNQTGFIFRLREELNMDDFIEDVVHSG